MDEAQLKEIEEWHRVRAENWDADSTTKDRYREVQKFAAALRTAWDERDGWKEIAIARANVGAALKVMQDRAARAESEVERLNSFLASNQDVVSLIRKLQTVREAAEAADKMHEAYAAARVHGDDYAQPLWNELCVRMLAIRRAIAALQDPAR